MEPKNFLERIKMLSTNLPEDCWIWQGGQKGGGKAGKYGAVKYARRSWLAHRLAYTLLVGNIPDGLQLDHLCRNRLCFNPKHLEPVTCAENLARGERATKTHCVNGHPLFGDNLKKNIPHRACLICQREAGRRFDKKRAKRIRIFH